jgi:hypothetical protein
MATAIQAQQGFRHKTTKPKPGNSRQKPSLSKNPHPSRRPPPSRDPPPSRRPHLNRGLLHCVALLLPPHSIAFHRNGYKNWKYRTLSHATTWINKLCREDYTNLKLRHEYNPLRLRQKLNQIFDVEWLPEVFKYVDDAIDIMKCSKPGIFFLRCRSRCPSVPLG